MKKTLLLSLLFICTLPSIAQQFSGTFDGTIVEDNVYTFPSDAQEWAGFANEDLSIYPLVFTDGGSISFDASSATAANVFFKFEKNPYPDVEPSYTTESVTVNGSESFTINVPSQGANTFRSFLLFIVERDVPVTITNISVSTSGTAAPEVSGCMDSNATNYDSSAQEAGFDGYGNSVCIYTSCDDVPENGCMYADSFGAFNEGFDAAACESYGGTACDGGASSASGCMDSNATNYDATATTQAVDQYSNILCTYASCDDVPSEGCMYATSFGAYAEGFGAAECSGYGGTPCDGGASSASGCLDSNATNYDASATTQAEDQYGNLLCTYTACDNVPFAGCMYADSFGPFAEGFGAAECSGYGGTPCEVFVGLFETEINAATIYPNPSADFIRISNTDAKNITVFNINGQQVLSVNDSDKEINVSHLSSGIYTLRVTDSKGDFTYSKLIKE